MATAALATLSAVGVVEPAAAELSDFEGGFNSDGSAKEREPEPEPERQEDSDSNGNRAARSNTSTPSSPVSPAVAEILKTISPVEDNRGWAIPGEEEYRANPTGGWNVQPEPTNPSENSDDSSSGLPAGSAEVAANWTPEPGVDAVYEDGVLKSTITSSSDPLNHSEVEVTYDSQGNPESVTIRDTLTGATSAANVASSEQGSGDVTDSGDDTEVNAGDKFFAEQYEFEENTPVGVDGSGQSVESPAVADRESLVRGPSDFSEVAAIAGPGTAVINDPMLGRSEVVVGEDGFVKSVSYADATNQRVQVSLGTDGYPTDTFGFPTDSTDGPFIGAGPQVTWTVSPVDDTSETVAEIDPLDESDNEDQSPSENGEETGWPDDKDKAQVVNDRNGSTVRTRDGGAVNLGSGGDYGTATSRDGDSGGNTATAPPRSGPCVDTDGDGWGWDGNKSCEMPGGGSTPNCVDTDGDGWGWDGHRSCEMH